MLSYGVVVSEGVDAVGCGHVPELYRVVEAGGHQQDAIDGAHRRVCSLGAFAGAQTLSTSSTLRTLMHSN